ncbi:MAG: hypothetical protein QF412_09500 [Planctomycetota bacterium]|jgi:hypothetical protein|nr:hypothetical protein [Planctomycetota bacterium]
MRECDECGSSNVSAVSIEGMAIWQCGLCDAIAGDDAAVARVLLIREAQERGIHVAAYPLVVALDRIEGFKVVACGAGDPEQISWPFVQMSLSGPSALVGLENLTKSLALSAHEGGVHWVVEVEIQTSMLFTLKPRFHRDMKRISSQEVLAVRKDLERLGANLERDMALSWWRG